MTRGEAAQVFASLLAEFTGAADEGAATKALALCAEDVVVGPPGAERDRAALEAIMAQRQAATYATRHAVSAPVISEATDDAIVGRAIVHAFRLVEDKLTMNIVDFRLTLARAGGDWLVKRLEISPFSSTALP